MSSREPISVLFVCLGNICRSPLAEAIMLDAAERRNAAHRFIIDSAGTSGVHAGKLADRRSIAVAKQHGIRVRSVSRQITAEDRLRWDLVIAMDRQNRDDLLRLGVSAERVRLIREFDPDADSLDVPDPYYGGNEGFHRVYTMLDRACSRLLGDLLAHHA